MYLISNQKNDAALNLDLCIFCHVPEACKSVTKTKF